jgi:hypothetical protein
VDPFVLILARSRHFRTTLQGGLPCREPADVLDAVAHGSVISWQHINLLGEYGFSDEKLRDSVGIRPPKLTP